MNFSAWSIRNPIPVILLFALLTFGGILSFRDLNIQDLPDVKLPVVTVSISLPGASPTLLENEVARKLENSVATLPGVRHVFSTINDGLVVTTVQFFLEKPLRDAVDDVRDAVSEARSNLPPEIREPVISHDSSTGRALLTYSASSNQYDIETLSWFIDNTLSKRLHAVYGVAHVSRIGGVSREIRVETDPERLAALNISVAEISRQLQRMQQEAPSGKVDISGAQQSVRTLNTAKSAAEIAALDMALSDGRTIKLGQAAKIIDTVAERSAMALLDGKEVVGFEIVCTNGADEIATAQRVRAAIDEFNRSQSFVRANEIFSYIEPVQESYQGSIQLLIEGALLTVLVVWLFLREWRATLIAAVALPMSVIPTFIVMYWFGFTLNTVTLLSLALVIGILVDDAIVEIENIVRHLKMGKTPYKAAMEATNEIGLAVIATTMAIIAVFLPTAFMSGVVGRYFKQFGWTAAVAVAASLIVARMLTPVMAAYLLKSHAQHESDSALMQKYLRLASWCIDHRGRTLFLSALFFAGSLLLLPLLSTGFIPAKDNGQTSVSIELPPGSTLNETYATAEQARFLLMQNKDVKQVYTIMGNGADDGDTSSAGAISQARRATLMINLTHRSRRDYDQSEVESALREQLQLLPGARVRVGSDDTGESFGIVLSSENSQQLFETAQRIQREIRTIPNLGNISSSADVFRPEVLVVPNLAKAADMGVNASAIGEVLRIATSGDDDLALAKLNLPERQIPIRVLMPKAARQDLNVLRRLMVPGKNGNVILSAVADVHMGSGPAQINRIDRVQNVNISVELNGQGLGDVIAKVNALPSVKNLPPSVKRERGGDAAMMQELFKGFAWAMASGIACVYLILVLLFKDFIQPVTILAALPLSVGGAFAAILLTDNSLSVPSLIGLLMLMGIAVKNSILLVEYTILARRDHGLGRFEALIDACHKRAQPIIMTTVAMAAGMLPIALGFGADPSFRAPMAISVIGGLITSTFLSLLVIPVVFTYLDDLLTIIKKVLASKTVMPHKFINSDEFRRNGEF